MRDAKRKAVLNLYKKGSWKPSEIAYQLSISRTEVEDIVQHVELKDIANKKNWHKKYRKE